MFKYDYEDFFDKDPSKSEPVTLKKVSLNSNDLRTNEVVGIFYKHPKVGERFIMFSDSISPEGVARMISTSPIQSMAHKQAGVTTIFTENSAYELDFRKEDSDG